MLKVYRKAPPGNHRKKRKKRIISTLLIVVGAGLFLASSGPLIYAEIWFNFKQLKEQRMVVDIPGNDDNISEGAVKDSVFARFLTNKPILVEPVNKDFSIVIEKIGVNAPIVENVSISDDDAYKGALKNGIAHAINSDKPSENAGNVYLFAHASLNFWELGRYATTFNLLRKLSWDDKIYIFYKNKAYVYRVVNIEKYEGWNTYPITRPVIEPILTLQTCDPPGTTVNRLVLTATLDRVQDAD